MTALSFFRPSSPYLDAPFKTVDQVVSADNSAATDTTATSNQPANGRVIPVLRGACKVERVPIIWYHVVSSRVKMHIAVGVGWNLFGGAFAPSKIMADDKVVYDVSGGDLDIPGVDFAFYDGLTAEKDPTMVEQLGEPNTQGFVGRVVIVFKGFPISETNGVPPIFTVYLNDATTCAVGALSVEHQTAANAAQIAGHFNGTNGVSTPDMETHEDLSVIDYTNRERICWIQNQGTYQNVTSVDPIYVGGTENEEWEDALRLGVLETDGTSSTHIDPGFTFGKPFNWLDSMFAWRPGDANTLYMTMDEYNYNNYRHYKFTRTGAADPWAVSATYLQAPSNANEYVLGFDDSGDLFVWHDVGGTDLFKVRDKGNYSELQSWTDTYAGAFGQYMCKGVGNLWLGVDTSPNPPVLYKLDLTGETITDVTPWVGSDGPFTEPFNTTATVDVVAITYNRADGKFYVFWRIRGEFYDAGSRNYQEFAWGTVSSDLSTYTYGGVFPGFGFRKSDGTRATTAAEAAFVRGYTYGFGWSASKNQSTDALGNAGYEDFIIVAQDRGVTSSVIDGFTADEDWGVYVVDASDGFSILHSWTDRDQDFADVPDAPTRLVEDYFESLSGTFEWRNDFHWDPYSLTASFYTNKTTGNNAANLLETGTTAGTVDEYYRFRETMAVVHLSVSSKTLTTCPSNAVPAGTVLKHTHFDKGQARIYELYYPDGAFSDGNVHIGMVSTNSTGSAYVIKITGIPAGTIADEGVKFLPIDGTEKAYISFDFTTGSDYEGLVNLSTGELAVSAITAGNAHRPRVWSELLGGSGRRFAGLAANSSGVSVVIADVTSDSFTVALNADGDEALAGVTVDATDPLKGRVETDKVTLYAYEAHASWGVVKITVQTDESWTHELLFPHTTITGDSQTFDGLWYDPGQDVILIGVSDDVSGDSEPTRKIDPATGTQIETLPINADEIIDLSSGAWDTAPGENLYIPDGMYITAEGNTLRIRRVSDGAEVSTFSPSAGKWVVYDHATGALKQRDAASGATPAANANWIKQTAGCEVFSDPLLKTFLTEIATLGEFAAGDLEFIGSRFDTTTFAGFQTASQADMAQIDRSVRAPFGVFGLDSGDKRKYVYHDRGASIVIAATIPDADLVITRRGDEIFSIAGSERGEDKGVTNLDFQYIDADGDFERETEPFTIENGVFSEIATSINKETLSTSLALRRAQIAELGEVRLQEMFLQTRTYQLILPPKYAGLEPADNIRFTDEGVTVTAEVQRAQHASDLKVRIECETFLLTDEIPDVQPIDPPAAPLFPVGAGQDARLLILDMPIIGPQHFDEGTYFSNVYMVLTDRGQAGWTGGYAGVGDNAFHVGSGSVRFWGIGDTLEQGAVPFAPVAAIVETPISAPPVGYSLDDINTLTFRVVSGDAANLASVTRTQRLNGANLFAYGNVGRWEVISIETLTDNGDGTVSGTLMGRGLRGTEIYQATHQANDWLVDIREVNLRRLLFNAISQPPPFTQYFRWSERERETWMDNAAVTWNMSVDHRKPWAPHRVNVAVSGSDLIIDAYLRRRTGVRWYNNGAAATTTGEANELVDIEIYDGMTLKRTETGVSLPYTYDSADITTDFGGMPETIRIKMFKQWILADLTVRRGHETDVTLDV